MTNTDSNLGKIDGTTFPASATTNYSAPQGTKRYRLFSEDSPNCMMIVSGSGRLTAMNASARLLFGYSADELERVDLESLGGQPLSMRLFDLGKEGRARVEGSFRRKDGSTFASTVNAAAMDGDSYQLLLTEVSTTENAGVQAERYGRRHGDNFEYISTPLIKVDLSGLKLHLEEIRAAGIRDMRALEHEEPHEVEKCLALMRIVDLNGELCRLIGIDRKAEFMGRCLSELFPAPGGNFLSLIECLLEDRPTIQDIEILLDAHPKGPRHLRMQPSLDHGRGHAWSREIFSFTDITREKRVQNELKAELDRMTVRVREVEHRVKNNLNVLSSILDLQARAMDDERCAAQITAARSRIGAIAKLYGLLSSSEDSEFLECRTFLQTLAQLLEEAYVEERQGITIRYNVAEQKLDAKRAVALGLIVTELTMNSMKYAFPSGKGGDIHIDVEAVGDALRLSIGDNGIGVPDGFDWRAAKGLGFQLVAALSQQLGAKTRLGGGQGFNFTLEVPISA